MRNATTYAVNSVVNNVRTGTRLMRIAMSSEAKHASPNNMEMNDFAVALACIPYDCQPYTDVSTSSRGKRKNGRKRRAVSRKYRQLMIVYRVNNQGGGLASNRGVECQFLCHQMAAWPLRQTSTCLMG